MTTEIDVQAVRGLIDGWVEAVNSNDREQIMSLVAEDFEMIPPGEPPVKGAKAHQYLEGFFDSFTLGLKSPTLELVLSGDWAFRRYAYQLTLNPKDGGKSVTHEGQGIHMFHRQSDGAWQFAKDIWN